MATGFDLSNLIRRYPEFDPLDPSTLRFEPLGNNGGFSGAQLFRFQTDFGRFLFRCHPPLDGFYRKRIPWIHQVIHFCKPHCDFLAPPLINEHGETLTRFQNRDWQVEKWIEGEATFHSENSDTKVEQVFEAIAAFHRAAERFYKSKGPCPALSKRLCRIDQLKYLDEARLLAAFQESPNPFKESLLDMAQTACRSFSRHGRRIRTELSDLVASPANQFDLIPCLRDVWHDHLLFDQQKLVGIVDYGATDIDHFATDLSRLAVSLAPDNPSSFRNAFDVYCKHRDLSESEWQLLFALNRSNLLLSSMNWIEWIFVENRQFEGNELIRARISRNLKQLQFLE